MSRTPSLQTLWQSVPVTDQVFQADQLTELPDPARRYLAHAIAPGTQLAAAVRLKMHGEIKLNTWQPFQAEQVIAWPQGMIWQAQSQVSGLSIRGWDRLVNGVGAMQWKLLGLIPVMKAKGPDVTRSAVGRMLGECMWLPSVFCGANWTAMDDTHAQATLTYLHETIELNLTVNQTGRLERLHFQRWGNPDKTEHRYIDFGGYIEAEGTFGGYTIPAQLRGGWYFGSERFEPEGEFFHATIDEATYR